MTAGPLAAALVGAMIGAAAIAQVEPALPPATDAAAPPAPNSEAGLLCSLARLHIVAGVGRRCFAGQDAPFQAAVADAVARLQAHAQDGPGMSRADLDAFARAMAGDDRDDAGVCDAEGISIYRTAREGGLEGLRMEVEHQLARPGPPRWGTCR